jgi:hypothetical protein
MAETCGLYAVKNNKKDTVSYSDSHHIQIYYKKLKAVSFLAYFCNRGSKKIEDKF